MATLSSGEKDVLTDATGPAASTAGEVQELDARGVASPLHVLRAHRALRGMRAGQVLRVLTSSEQTLAEFQALSKYVVGYELVSQEQFGDEFIHVLRKKR